MANSVTSHTQHHPLAVGRATINPEHVLSACVGRQFGVELKRSFQRRSDGAIDDYAP
jgi:hypothetical protein